MDKSLKKVYIYGKLKKLIGLDFVELSGDTVYELVSGVSANFKSVLQPEPGKAKLVCKVRGFDTEESLHRTLTEEETEIHLYPTLLGGGGNGGLMKIIVGVLLVAVVAFAVVATGGAAALLSGAWALTTFGSALLMSGVTMILGGLLELMSPQPKMDMSSSNDIESSKYLGSQGNTVKIGTCIPIIFGEHLAFGHYISFNVDATNVAA